MSRAIAKQFSQRFEQLYGILNINKAVGLTSRDVVTRVVKVIRQETGNKIKAGHAGTLDPLASGVLIVCLGKATRLIPYVQQTTKVYRGVFQLDVTSDSADSETEIKSVDKPVRPAEQSVRNVLPQFLGHIWQKPPAYSAISVGGQRAYKLARKGIEFEIKPKEVYIKQLEILHYDYPDLELSIECGSGTYIRSLGRDLARALNSDAVMTSLERTSIGSFRVNDGLHSEEIEFDSLVKNLNDPITALGEMPTRTISSEVHQRLASGRFLDPAEIGFSAGQLPEEIAVLDEQGKLLAILEPRQGQLKSKMNLVP